MLSRHKMLVILSFVWLLAFIVWAVLVRGSAGLETRDGAARHIREPISIYELERETPQRMRRPSMTGPRGAIPATPPGSWILSKDYPAIALAGDIEGRTAVRVQVSQFGEVTSCEITKRSGYAELDDRVCNAVSTRARFYPALDHESKPTEGSYATMVIWKLNE